ncbi:hypothetical protein KI387_036843, partial [Taxus chinensis]
SSKVRLSESLVGSASRCVVKEGISCRQDNSPLIKLNENTCKGPSFQATDKRLLSQLPERTKKETKNESGKGTRNGGLSRKRSRAEKALDTEDRPNATDFPVKKIVSNNASYSGVCNDKSRKSNRKPGKALKIGEKRSGKPDQTRVDCFGIKNGSLNSYAGENNILGVYGIKAEPVNVSKYMADLSLEDLLNGDCKVPRFSRVDTRESHNNNESVLQCVQKICQILPSQSVTSKKNANSVDTNCNLKEKLSRSTADKENVEVSSLRKEIQNSEPCEADFKDVMKASLRPVFPENNLPFYQPEEFLQCLGISPFESLDSLISQSPIRKTNGLQGSSFQNSNTCMAQNGCIPPFPWSLPYCGPCKSSLDICRSSANRSINARQCIQIGGTQFTNKYSVTNSQSTTFSGLKLESKNKFEGCLDVPTSIPFVQSFPFLATGLPVSKSVDKKDIKLLKDSSLTDPHRLAVEDMSGDKKFSVQDLYGKSAETFDVSNKQPKYNASCVQVTSKSEKKETFTDQFPSDCSTRVTDAIILAPEKLGMLDEEERNTVPPAFSVIPSALRVSHSSLPLHDQDNAPVSPRAQAAARTLCDMAHCSSYQKKDGQNTAKIKRLTLISWPGALSQRVAKVHKSLKSMGNDSDFKCPKKVESKEIKAAAAGDLKLQNKGLSLERKKSLSQVNDTSRIVKHSASRTGKVPGEIINVSKRIDELGVSCDNIELMKGRIFCEQARESTRDLGKGLNSSITTSSHEASLETVSTETHARTIRRTIPPLAAQKSGMVGGLKFCRDHFSQRGSGRASVGPDQSSMNCRSSHRVGSSSSIQNNAFNTTPKCRQSLPSQEGNKNRDSARERSSKP